MSATDSVRVVSSSIKIPPFPPVPPLFLSSTLNSPPFDPFPSLSSHLRKLKAAALRLLTPRFPHPCFASLYGFFKDPDIKRHGKEVVERVLVSEVLIRNKDGEELDRPDLVAEAASALKFCRANSALTAREVHEDVARIIDSGYFFSCVPITVDTRDGIRLIFQVEPNQEFQGLICEGANVLPAKFLEDSFRDGYGKIINVRRLDEVLSNIRAWYAERGLYGMVTDADIFSGGIIRLAVSEVEVNDIIMQFLDKKTGEPTTGKTKPETILRQLTTKKGQAYSWLQGKRDVDTILTMGVMEDASIIPKPAGDTGKVNLVMNLVERDARCFTAGGGISSGISGNPFSALVGSLAYSHRNVFGRNQRLNLSLERGQMDSLYRINYTDPWIEGDDKRTSRSFTLQNSRIPGVSVHGSYEDQGNVTVERVVACIEYGRPLRPKWSGTAGVSFQHSGARNDRGIPILKDCLNCPLTASGNEHDNSLVAKVGCVYTGSGDHGSSMVVLDAEQGVPILFDWLNFSRVTARARKGLEFGPASFVFSLSGGHVLGQFSPHEAFAIGGINSVRGYEDGAVGSGRSYIVGSGEISFPLFGPTVGVVFADYGSDLGSGPMVPGDPAGARGKPGSGYGYGAGIRVSSPFGPLRLEYAVNDKKTMRFHFGVGSRS